MQAFIFIHYKSVHFLNKLTTYKSQRISDNTFLNIKGSISGVLHAKFDKYICLRFIWPAT